MQDDNVDAKEILAQAKAIHLSMQHGVISYHEAKQRAEPLLKLVNHRIELIAKKHNRKPEFICFSDLGIQL